jgi:thymidylate synthase (FAD)
MNNILPEIKQKLISHTPLEICANAIRTCWQSYEKSDSDENGCGKNDKALIDRIGNKFKHASTLEHLVSNLILSIDDKTLIELLKNKYIIYNAPLLTINFRSLLDILNNHELYNLNVDFLITLKNIISEDYHYLLEDSFTMFLKMKNENIEKIGFKYKDVLDKINKFEHIEYPSYSNSLDIKLTPMYNNFSSLIFGLEDIFSNPGISTNLLEDLEKNLPEHIFYTFKINGISRGCLQEVVRHQHLISYSVKSSRYTLKELKDEAPFSWLGGREALYKRANKYLVFTDVMSVNHASVHALENLRKLLVQNISNDKAKYALPENYKTELTITLNMNGLRNFLKLRTDKAALWEIRELAYKIFEIIPNEQKFLFKDYLYIEKLGVDNVD